MALDGVLFDFDGTILDTNPAHVEAWRRAFAECGYKVLPDRIAAEIGQGGDLLVSAVLGAEAQKKDGDRLRTLSKEEFLGIAKKEHFHLLPGAEELVRALRGRGIKGALATSSSQKHLDAMFGSAGVDVAGWFDAVTTADDARTSKPAPDVVHAALDKLGLGPMQCAMVGDTPYDHAAARQAGVVGFGVLTGDNEAPVLRRAGARGVWADCADLLAHLDEALALASPGPAHWTGERLGTLMGQALAAAGEAAERGEFPSACLLVGGDGRVLGAFAEEVAASLDRTAHAVRVAVAAADPRGLVLVANLEPCVLCTGAAVQAGVDAVVYGLSAPADEGVRRVVPPGAEGLPFPRFVGGVRPDDNRPLLQAYLQRHREPAGVARVRRLLDGAEAQAGQQGA